MADRNTSSFTCLSKNLINRIMFTFIFAVFTLKLNSPPLPYFLLSPSPFSSALHLYSFFGVNAALPPSRVNCLGAIYPMEAFSSQSDMSKVYLRVDRIKDDGFMNAGLVKYASVFGVRVLGSANVNDYKILHAVRILAKLLDSDENGVPDNRRLIGALIRRSATLGLVDNKESMERVVYLMPKEYPCFIFLVLELDQGIVPNGIIEPDCKHNIDSSNNNDNNDNDFNNISNLVNSNNIIRSTNTILRESINNNKYNVDRTIGLIGDFLIESGYPSMFPFDSSVGRLMDKSFYKSLKEDLFTPTATTAQCDLECRNISFQSWALSSALGVDACSCRKHNVWKACTPRELKNIYPELYGSLIETFQIPDGYYQTGVTVF